MKKYLWQNEEIINKMKNNDPGTVDLVTNMMNQNLDHARHLENERLSYCACMTALVAGIFAFKDNMNVSLIRILYMVLICMIIISWCLTERWNKAFDRHIIYAKGCYFLLQASILGETYEISEFDQPYLSKQANADTSREDLYIPVINKCDLSENIHPLKSMPLYCFKVDNPRWIFKNLQTKLIFRAYYGILLVAVIAAIIYTFLPQTA